MKHFLTLFLLLAVVTVLAAEEKKYEFTEDQLQGLKQQEEKYKENPAMLDVIQQVKKGLGITDEDMSAAPVQPAPATAGFKASMQEADAAYRNKDYETAFKHYQALAAGGDADASMRLGIMYEAGVGTEKDTAAADAYYRKAAEAGVEGSAGLMDLVEETGMTEADRQRSEELYHALAGTGPDQAAKAESGQENMSRFPGIQPPADRDVHVQQQALAPGTRLVRLSPEKIRPMPHTRPAITGSGHYQPEKFTRQVSRLP